MYKIYSLLSFDLVRLSMLSISSTELIDITLISLNTSPIPKFIMSASLGSGGQPSESKVEKAT